MDVWRGGVVRRAELIAAGMSRRDLDRALAAGAIVRVRGGWYARADLDSDRMRAARVGARIACISAARLLGVWIPPESDSRLHLAAHPHTAVSARGYVVHFARSEPPLAHCADRLLVDAVSAIEALCLCQPTAVAWVVVESALERRLITPDEWERILARLPARRRALLAAAGSLSGSGTESEFIRHLRRLGIGFRQQVRVGRDRADVELDDGLLIEIDSRTHHDTVADARRDTRFSIAGRDVLRFSYVQIWFEWPSVEGALLAARARRRARSEGRR